MRDWNRCHKCGVMTSQEYKVVHTETVVRPCCGECAKPAPVRLSAEMLGEEDREALQFAKGVLLQFRSNMDQHRNKAIEREEIADVVSHYIRERDMAHKGVLLILRLLNNHGEG